MSRRNLKYIVGNWKMNHKLADIKEFFTTFSQSRAELHCHPWIAPQFIHIPILKELAFTLGNIQVGAQNMSHAASGAYTGEISATALSDMGIPFVIIGHSERRNQFKEDNELLSKKIKLALASDLQAIYCIGETAIEFEKGTTKEIIKEQLHQGLSGISDCHKLLIAYEPVWAIGTGKVATPKIAEDVHAFIRNELAQLFTSANEIPLLYGGSVNPENISGLLSMPNIDGGLIGGASLKAKDFLSMCHQARPFARS